ncbi:hypothetical protein K438DRAFT_1978695 [Mycena galopus ATCC 62051]|nr:hypothetical protein K438DRAFT_1978695 [Mycena galopus ATCC 62051]
MADPSEHLDEVNLIQSTSYITMGEVFLYGAYAVMFGFYIHVLHTRGMAKNRILPAVTIILFILCTTHVACVLASTVLYNRAFTGQEDVLTYYAVVRATNVIYVTSNVVADSIFWRVIIIPILSTVGVAGELLGFRLLQAIIRWATHLLVEVWAIPISSPGPRPPYSGVPFFVFYRDVAAYDGYADGSECWKDLVAGEQSSPGPGKEDEKPLLHCVLESGALYCVGAIALIVVGVNAPIATIGLNAFPTGAILGQLVGIAPTIIAVRVGLGKSVENVDSFVSQPRVRVVTETQRAGPSSESIEREIDIRPLSGDHGTKAEVV